MNNKQWVSVDDPHHLPEKGQQIQCKGIVYSLENCEEFEEHRGVYYADIGVFSWSPWRDCYEMTGARHYEITHWRVF